MNSKRYWKNRLPFLLTNLVCMAALTVFLLVCGNSASAVVLILIVWALILLMGLVLTYWKRKRQMKKLLDMAKQLSERYLISEVMELPEQAEDQEMCIRDSIIIIVHRNTSFLIVQRGAALLFYVALCVENSSSRIEFGHLFHDYYIIAFPSIQ